MKTNPVFDLDPDGMDLLDMIVRNRDAVRHLRGNGIDASAINRILLDTHGWGEIMEVPLITTKSFVAENRKIEYALRYIHTLVKNDAITDEEKDCLCNIWNRLLAEYVPLKTDKRERKIIKVKMRLEVQKEDKPDDRQGVKKKAKTYNQMIGMQVAALYKYMQQFYRLQPRRKVIYELIAELLEVVYWEKFTTDQIANFDRNNC